jgi:hypothetical protein
VDRKLQVRLATAGLCLILAVAAAWGQATTASILGTLKDSTGAAVPGITVVATNLETNFSRSAVSDEVGHYTIQFLPVGTYRVEAEAPGFKRFVQTGIVLEVDRNARIDPVLEVGAVTESIHVTADAPLVDTTRVALGQTVTNTEILNLPLVGRDVYGLLSVTPGVQNNESTNAFGPPGQQVSVYGSSNAGTGGVNFTLDGGQNIQSLRNTGNPAPNTDAVQEFRVTTHLFDAEYGRFGGGVVNVITKSGSNAYHGSLFEYLRNDALNAQQWNTLQKDRVRRNNFGGSFGGPIRKDKLFFFTSYSGLRDRQVAIKNSARVPTALERQGDFSASSFTVRDPVTRAPFPGNRIPSERFDPTAKNILDKYVPLANLPGSFYEARVATAPRNDDFTGKIDYMMSSAHQLTGSYFLNTGSQTEVLNGTLPWSERVLSWKQQNFNVRDTWTKSPNTVNVFQITYVRHIGGRLNTPAISLGDLGSKYQIQGEPALPNINVRTYFQLGTAIDGPRAGSDYYQIRDTVSLIKGRHSLRFGFEGSLDKTYQNTNLNNYGTFDFRPDNTGNEFADFLLGLPRSFNQDAPVYKTDSGWYTGLFLQDEFRIHPRLLLNLGLRHEIQFPMTDPQDRKNVFVPGVQSQVVSIAPRGMLFPGDPGISRGIIPIDKNNFAPRVGLAWDPFGDGKTSVRAGAGVYYGSMGGNMANGTADRPPFTIRQQFTNVKSLTDPYGNLPGGVAPFPYFYSPENPRFLAGLPVGMKSRDLDFRWPYTYQVNFSVQRQILSDLSMTAAYVSSLSHKLPIDLDVNYPVFGPGATTSNFDQRRPYAGYSDIGVLKSAANSAYHGLELSAEKRMSRNFSFRGYYAFGKGLEDYDMQSGTRDYPMNSSKYKLDRGRTSNDVTHRFVMSGIWQIDYLRGAHPVLRYTLNDWQISGIAYLYSGSPLTVTAGDDINRDGQSNDRADLVGDPYLDPDRARAEKLAKWFNTSAFARPAFGTDGNAGRNIIEGPGRKTLNLGLFRSFSITEGMKLQLRLEATNALNMVNLSNPSTALNSATFGQIRSARNMREAQVGLRLWF